MRSRDGPALSMDAPCRLRLACTRFVTLAYSPRAAAFAHNVRRQMEVAGGEKRRRDVITCPMPSSCAARFAMKTRSTGGGFAIHVSVTLRMDVASMR